MTMDLFKHENDPYYNVWNVDDFMTRICETKAKLHRWCLQMHIEDVIDKKIKKMDGSMDRKIDG